MNINMYNKPFNLFAAKLFQWQLGPLVFLLKYQLKIVYFNYNQIILSYYHIRSYYHIFHANIGVSVNVFILSVCYNQFFIEHIIKIRE